MQSYQEFLDLSVGFPQDGFEIIDDELIFQDLNLMEMIETYGTPLRFTYLPIITKKIQQAKLFFSRPSSKIIIAVAINIAIAPKARTLSTL
jgi:arginine decarboxylase